MKNSTIFSFVLSLLCGCAENQESSEAETVEIIEEPLGDILVEDGLPVLVEYAELLEEFEQSKEDAPKNLVDLAFGVANTAQKLAISSSLRKNFIIPVVR